MISAFNKRLPASPSLDISPSRTPRKLSLTPRISSYAERRKSLNLVSLHQISAFQTRPNARFDPRSTGDRITNISAPLALSPSNTIAAEAFDDSPIICSTPRTPLPTSPIQKPNRFSIDSDATLVAHDDDFVKDLSDNALDIKDCEWFGDESIFNEADCSGNLLPGTKPLAPDDSDGPSQRSQLILLDKHQTSDNPGIALLRSANSVDALTHRTKKTCTLGSTPTQSTTLRPKPPDTKHTVNRFPHYATTALRHQSFHWGKQKYDPRTFHLIAACDTSYVQTSSNTLL
ncbi:hypothetical protein DFH29DRAFT_497618 [Suillus ampliporus]|nr:hypothetical protein DFH29DRAFT_497618 [Suillus ampliporus]